MVKIIQKLHEIIAVGLYVAPTDTCIGEHVRMSIKIS